MPTDIAVQFGSSMRPIDTDALARLAHAGHVDVGAPVDGVTTLTFDVDLPDWTVPLVQGWAELQQNPAAQRRYETQALYADTLAEQVEDAADELLWALALRIGEVAAGQREEATRAGKSESDLAGRVKALEEFNSKLAVISIAGTKVLGVKVS